jgi:hypothetical protein
MVRGRASEASEGSCIGQGCAFLDMIGGDWAKEEPRCSAKRGEWMVHFSCWIRVFDVEGTVVM